MTAAGVLAPCNLPAGARRRPDALPPGGVGSPMPGGGAQPNGDHDWRRAAAEGRAAGRPVGAGADGLGPAGQATVRPASAASVTRTRWVGSGLSIGGLAGLGPGQRALRPRRADPADPDPLTEGGALVLIEARQEGHVDFGLRRAVDGLAEGGLVGRVRAPPGSRAVRRDDLQGRGAGGPRSGGSGTDRRGRLRRTEARARALGAGDGADGSPGGA